ncbi:glycosyltransferase family 4 protein [Bradyrhizobium sp. Tv2a-2]|uniref:glycosyltransferase family 4 protein n=1 Tax=Bradyrhizobium sp. Tv2a-2 TaxID=113395 RepID=UPI000415BF07|nr:glycosyltransferase family 4 protein [Bradyrhizobium sp. Tv2a-2]
MTKPIRALLLAEMANPEWTSVPLIGWSLAFAISKRLNAHIVTQVRNRGAFVRAGLTEGRDFTVIDNERFARPIYRLAEVLRGGAGKGWTTTMALSSITYYSFESAVWKQFHARIRSGEFNIVHRITPVSPTTPSPISTKLNRYGVPFILGPLNGGLPWPSSFRDRQHAEKEWLSYLRSAYKFLPSYYATREKASAIICGSKYTLSEMPEWARSKCSYIPENGFEPSRFEYEPRGPRALPLHAAFVGRLVPYKGLDMLLEAIAPQLAGGQLILHVIGDGPQKAEIESLIHQLGIGNAVLMHGWKAHDEIQPILKRCDFSVLPSVREFGGGVVVESMALGVPPIVADYGGPAELVTDGVGIRVPFADRSSLVSGLRDAISDLLQFPDKISKLSKAAREHAVSNFTWDAKASRIIEIYNAVLGQ